MASLALALRRPHLLFRLRPSPKDALEQKPKSGNKDNTSQQKPPLCAFSKLPKWYQDNPHIISSYRPVSHSYNACIHSLGYLHNETVNIYTHLLPALILALALPTLQIHISRIFTDAPWTDRFMLTLTPMACLFTLSLSATYHTLMNHSHTVSSSCLLLDYTGILALILASFISGVYVGFYDSPFHQRVYWAMILVLVVTSCLLVLHPRLQGPVYRPHRTAAFILTALSGFAPVFHGVYLYGLNTAFHEKGVKWWLAEGAWYGLGAMFFAKRVPESLPWTKRNQRGDGKGLFDVWGSSHQIFHCCVVAGAACHCWGVWSAWRCAV
ncbi:HlyIII-domain-containing protein [Melanomma pulvis-pyrius CBS 109.77]|uniref:HlyIII-domain-containing protein n=1 Tax=Melanomma pulvis-pyrius CBS 109.77 TaxID=1314802 RepID=A0A6A6WWW5_9PLEO|nr:HlyIII-domain-containing protein [Melanomma pulvis-pyrius CBS 109.77]